SGHIVLFFPRKSKKDYVVAEKPFVKTLTAFTVSMWVQMANDSKTKKSTNALFSYAINDDIENEILIEMDVNIVWLSIRYTIKHLGKYYFYIDGVKKIEGVWEKGYQIRAPGAIVLGQDQDDYIGGFQEHESLTGNLTNVNMWDKALDASRVAELAKRCPTGEGN
ncbi:hypothetical protein QZH41_016014, partial [Actinostola sp. cb2023]